MPAKRLWIKIKSEIGKKANFPKFNKKQEINLEISKLDIWIIWVPGEENKWNKTTLIVVIEENFPELRRNTSVYSILYTVYKTTTVQWKPTSVLLHFTPFTHPCFTWVKSLPCDLFSFFLTCLRNVTVATHIPQSACRVREQIVGFVVPFLLYRDLRDEAQAAWLLWQEPAPTEPPCWPLRTFLKVIFHTLLQPDSLATTAVYILSLGLRHKCHHWLSFTIGLWDSWWHLENMLSTNLDTWKKKTSVYPQENRLNTLIKRANKLKIKI